MNPIAIRPAIRKDSLGIAHVQVDSYRSAYKGFFPQTYLDLFSYEAQAADWERWLEKFTEDILLVAETAEGQVAGYVLARAQRDIHPGYDSEVIAIHMLPPLKGQGIGRALLRRAVEALMRRGCQSTMLWTLQGNPIRAWYERLDGELLGEKRDWWDDWEMVEVAYGWNNLQALRGRLMMMDTALLVIDVQRGLFERSIPVYHADQLIRNINTLIQRAHLAGAPVFFIQHSTDTVLPRGTPEWQFHPRVQPSPDDVVVEKHHGSCFEDTDLQPQLDELNIRRVVICGLVSYGCVRSASLDGHARGYEVVLAQDAHSSFAKDAAKKIEQVNQELSKDTVTLKPTAEVSF